MNFYNNLMMPFGAEINSDGLWCQVLNRCQGTGQRAALFLDRDGVIVEDVHYLHREEDVCMVDGAIEIIKKANSLAIPVVIVTNQAGIGYGKYGWQEFISVQEKILDEIAGAGTFVNAVFACPFHTNGKKPFQHDDHPGRKPNPGMLYESSRRLSINLPQSWIIGDRASDLEAGKNAGLSGGMHVRTGHGSEISEQTRSNTLSSRSFSVTSGASIADANKKIPILNA